MKCRFTVADPAGNITALVTDNVPPSDYTAVAAAIMQHPGLDVEQVGFIRPSASGTDGRLDMMGGEFCANATRSFARYLAFRQNLDLARLRLAVSGMDRPLTVDVEGDCCTIDMPLPQRLQTLDIDGAGSCPVVAFDGISHCIVDAPPSARAVEMARAAVMKSDNPAAVGVLFYQNGFMTPVVFVAETGTTVYEGSCASGTAALGVVLAQDWGDGLHRREIAQPRGTLTLGVEKRSQKIVRIQIGGDVALFPPMEIDLSK